MSGGRGSNGVEGRLDEMGTGGEGGSRDGKNFKLHATLDLPFSHIRIKFHVSSFPP